MKKLLLVALATFAGAAQADDHKFYAGAGVAFWNYSETGFKQVMNMSSLELAAGMNVWQWVNVEGRIGAGVEGGIEQVADKADGLQSSKVSLKNYESLYFKPELKNDIAKLYGLLGVSRVESESSNAKTNRSLTVTGLSYGVGMGFLMSETTVINLEFRRLVQESDYKFSGMSLGFDMAF